MRSRIIRLCLGISLTFLLGGCAAVGSALNPYEDDFTCAKRAPFGKCETTLEVYNDLVPSAKSESTVAVEPSAVPAGYEIVPAPVEDLPAFKDQKGMPGTGERYKVVKRADQVDEPVAEKWASDGGDGVVYGMSKPIEKTKSSPASLPSFTVRPAPETAYRDASLAKAAKLLKEPVTPVVIPPLVMRVLILPRKGEDGELNMAQYSYIMVDQARWSMGDYLSAMPEE